MTNDQQAAVEAFATVTNILDVLDNDITAFATLRGQWRSPRVPVHVFERHLTAFRDAVAKIKRWIALGPFDTLALYSRQLKLCLSCCRLIATRIHVEISHFRTAPERELVASRHHDVGFNRQGFYDIQKALEVQRTVLLHVLSEMSGCDPVAESVSESEDLKGDIEDSQPPVSWQVLRMEMDKIRSSIAVHSDPDLIQAFYSGGTGRIVSPGAALVFNLEKPPCSLHQPRQQKISLAESIKKLFSRTPPELPPLGSRAAKRRSWEIDQFLADKFQGRWGQIRLMRVGIDPDVDFVSLIKARYMSVAQRRSYRQAVIQGLIDGYKTLAWEVGQSGSEFHRTETQEYLDQLSTLVETDVAPNLLAEEIAEAIVGLHQDTQIQDLISNPPKPLHPSQFSLQNAGRILSPDYIPTDLDIARVLKRKLGHLVEETMHLGRLNLAVLRPRYCGARKILSQAFSETMGLLFMARLDDYDTPIMEDHTGPETHMTESLNLFDHIGNSRHFVNRPFVLLLDGADAFERKLGVTPVKQRFPEYDGDGSFEDAAKFFVGKFHELNQSGRVIYTFVYDSTDIQSVDRVMEGLEEALEQVGLKDSRSQEANWRYST